jgi:hypothetical protein
VRTGRSSHDSGVSRHADQQADSLLQQYKGERWAGGWPGGEAGLVRLEYRVEHQRTSACTSLYVSALLIQNRGWPGGARLYDEEG